MSNHFKMSDVMVRDFIKHQATLMNHTVVIKSNKELIKPEAIVTEAATPEQLYNEIIQKRLGKKKVMTFLQACVNSLIDDE